MIGSSLLDTDLYKLSMGQVIFHQFPGTAVEYEFKCRNKDVKLGNLVKQIQDEIDHLCTIQFTEPELKYLSTIRFIKPDMVDFLSLLKLNRKYVTIFSDDNEDLHIRIKGPWLYTIWFEIPILYIVNELYFRQFSLSSYGEHKLWQKLDTINAFPELNIKYSDFGTRRRYSRYWHERVIQICKEMTPNNFATSNVLFAMKYDLVPIGTMAHEYIQAFQGFNNVRLSESQKYALQSWADEYRGDLGIALSDTLGFDAFLRDFDLYFCKLFDGCRHDSGNPFIWGDRLIEHYKKNRIDPMTKQVTFSDGLTFPKIIELAHYFKDRINVNFGIGTNLTNDIGFEALNIVIKMVKCNGRPVAKLSDSPGKGMCEDEGFLTYLKSVFGIK